MLIHIIEVIVWCLRGFIYSFLLWRGYSNTWEIYGTTYGLRHHIWSEGYMYYFIVENNVILSLNHVLNFQENLAVLPNLLTDYLFNI